MVKKSTFVSFCVNVGRGDVPETTPGYRHYSLYMQGLTENLDTVLPLVVYSDFMPELPKHRNETNLKSYNFDIKSIEEEFPNFNEYVKYYNTTKKDELGTFYYYYVPLVVLKFKKIIDVINENPFNSDYFFWIDSHFTRGILNLDFLYNADKFDEINDELIETVGNKFILFYSSTRPFGFFWGGKKDVLLKIYENYFKIFFEFLPKKLLTEELIFDIMKDRYPDLFNVISLVDYGTLYKKGLVETLKLR